MDAHPFVLEKLERSSLAEQAVQSLLRHLEDEKLKPGTALPSEAKLGDMLGVSRSVVREALRTLKGLGVVKIENGKNPIVRRDLDASALGIYFSRALQVLENSTEDLMEVRTSLESRAVALAARRRQPAQMERMLALVVQMQGRLRQPAAYARLDTELHLEIARASGNLLLFQMIGSIRASLETQSCLGMSRRESDASLQRVQDFHADIVAMICNGDSTGSAERMHAHMDDALRVLCAAGATGAVRNPTRSPPSSRLSGNPSQTPSRYARERRRSSAARGPG